MKTVTTWSRKNQRGMIRLALLASLCIGAFLLFLSYSKLSAAVNPGLTKPSLATSQRAAPTGCGCSGEVGTAKYAYDASHKSLRLVEATNEESSQLDPNTHKGSSTPPSLYAVIVAPNQKLPLATTYPLPSGNGIDEKTGKTKPGGFWTADYGKISPDGRLYTAPAVVPPLGGIDVIQYSGTGDASSTIPNTISLTIVVRDPTNPSQINLFPCIKTLQLPLIKIDQEAKDVAKRLAIQSAVWSGQTDKNFNSNVAIADSKPVAGYLLPSWSDYGNVQVYVPHIDPATGLQTSGQKVCRRGPLSGPPTENASNYASNYQLDTHTSVDPLTQVQTGTSGWTTVGNLSLTLNGEQIKKIDLQYKGIGGSAHFSLKAGVEWKGNLRSMSNRYERFYYIDHWRVTGTKKKWIWVGEDKLYQTGLGNLYDPLWYNVISGYPPNGEPQWNNTWLTTRLGLP